MSPFYLEQNTIRYIFIPLNTVVLISILVIMSIPYSQMAKVKMEYGVYVYWLFKPTVLCEIILTACVLVMGYTGAIKYNRCWQGSFSFFLIMLLSIAICSVIFCDGIRYSADTVIKRLIEQKQSLDSINTAFSQLNCQTWDDTKDGLGCHSLILEEIGDFPEKARPYTVASLCIIVLYTIFNIFAFFFISSKEDKVEEVNDDSY